MTEAATIVSAVLGAEQAIRGYVCVTCALVLAVSALTPRYFTHIFIWAADFYTGFMDGPCNDHICPHWVKYPIKMAPQPKMCINLYPLCTNHDRCVNQQSILQVMFFGWLRLMIRLSPNDKMNSFIIYISQKKLTRKVNNSAKTSSSHFNHKFLWVKYDLRWATVGVRSNLYASW